MTFSNRFTQLSTTENVNLLHKLFSQFILNNNTIKLHRTAIHSINFSQLFHPELVGKCSSLYLKSWIPFIIIYQRQTMDYFS